MKPTVISQDTPWGEIPSLLLPAYGETWLMVAIVMLFVVTLGGLVGVVLFNASPRGLFPHALLYRLLNWVVNMGRSLPFLGADGRHYPVHLLADRHHDWHTRRGRADDRRRRPVLWPSGGERAARVAGGGHRGGGRLRRVALANHCQRAAQ